jgi:hypothetical protein
MKSIISLMAIASTIFVARAGTLEDVYKKVCTGKSYTTTVNNVPQVSIYYQPWEALLGYALGTQANTTDESSTCYGQVDETYRFFDTIVTQVYDIVNTFSFDTVSSKVAILAQNINNLVIQLSDQNIACQDNVKVKQLATRTSKISGVFNWVFTIAYALTFDEYIKPTLGKYLPTPEMDQKLKDGLIGIYDQIKAIIDAPENPVDCHKLGYNFGVFVSESLEAKVESFVQFVEVQKFA